MILPVYFDHLLLADTVTSSLSLEVVLGVPVAVIDDHRVRRHQVDAEAAGAGGEQEALDRGLHVELLNVALPVSPGGAAVQAPHFDVLWGCREG